MEWLDANVAYWHWLVVGILLALLEILVPSFFMLWLGISAALVAGVLLAFEISFTQQLLLWIILSIITTTLWFKLISPKMRDKSFSGMAKEAIIGQVGQVITFNPDTSQGTIRFHVPILGSSEWQYISDDELKTGDRARISELSGNKLIIKKQ